MQYLNFKNEPESGNRVAMAVSSEDLLKKKESYWLLGLVVTLIVIGSIVFYSAHTGRALGIYRILIKITQKQWIKDKLILNTGLVLILLVLVTLYCLLFVLNIYPLF